MASEENILSSGFENSEKGRAFIRDNILSIVDELAMQFKEPEDAYKELIQNAVDASTAQIDVNFEEEEIDDKYVRLRINFEDYGSGMNLSERDNFFLKLFKSSKEKDPKKIGKYGIGISSVFALGLEELSVESTGSLNESWGLQIKGIDSMPKYAYSNIEKRKGTKISLVKKVKKSELKKYKDKVGNKIKYYCDRTRTPIYIDGKMINRNFDLDTRVKVSGSTSSLEYVIGLGVETSNLNNSNNQFELFNNRFKLFEGKNLLEDTMGATFLVSSSYFHHTFSRESVVKDKAYDMIMGILKKEYPRLFIKALEMIEFYQNNPLDMKLEVPSLDIISDEGHRFKVNQSNLENVLRYLDGKSNSGGFVWTNTKTGEEYSYNPDYTSYLKGTFSDVETVKKQVLDLEAKLSEYNIKRDQLYTERRKRDAELISSWKFVIKYIEMIQENINSKRRTSGKVEFLAKKLIFPNNFEEHLKKSLPQGTGDYKIIKTLTHGDVSIIDILDYIVKEKGIFYYLRSTHNRSLVELLSQNDKLTIFDPKVITESAISYSGSRSHVTNKVLPISYNTYNDLPFQQNLLCRNLLGDEEKYKDASQMYKVSIKIDPSEYDERSREFLEIIKNSLSKRTRAVISDIYYTNSRFDIYGGPIIVRENGGKIDFTEDKGDKRGLLKRAGKNALSFLVGGQDPVEVAINLDSNEIKNLMTCIFIGDTETKEFGIETLRRTIHRSLGRFV